MSTAAPPAAPTSENIKIEDVGPARKRLTITVPAQMVSARLRESMGTLATQTALPGFRKGHVPAGLLQRKFGESVKNEAKNQLIAGAYASAIEHHSIKPLSDPEPVGDMEKITLEENQPLTFSVEIEVMPDFELPAVEGIEIKKPVMDVTAEHVDKELERQKLHLGTPHRVERDFEKGDRIGGTAKVWRDKEDEPFFTNDRVLIVHPGTGKDAPGQIFGLLIDDMGEALGGKAVGDTVTFAAKGPENYEREDVRGKSLRLEFSIKVAERVEPATTEKVVENYGLAYEAILREQIQLALEHRRDNEQASAMREQVGEALVEMVDFPLPEKISGAQVTRALERTRVELLGRGISPDEIEDRLAHVRTDSEAATKRRLKMFFLMNRFAEKLNITVNEQEINGRIALIASQRGMRPDKLKTELQQAGRTSELVGQIRDEKTGDKLVGLCKQVEVSAEDWNKTLQEKQKQAREKSASRTKPAARDKDADDDTPAAKEDTKHAPAAKSKGSPKAKANEDDKGKGAKAKGPAKKKKA